MRLQGRVGLFVSGVNAMKAVKLILAAGAAMAAVAIAAPASAQYYPANPYGPTPYGYGQGYNSYGYNGYGNMGGNSQAAIGQCTNAVQARLKGGNGYGYGYGNAYGYNGYGGGRVLGISRVEPRSGGGLTIRGVATTGRAAGYGYTPNSPVDLTFRCKTDYRGYVMDVDVRPATRSDYGYTNNYTPYNQDYSEYGYRRY
jgi:hypothetical protein